MASQEKLGSARGEGAANVATPAPSSAGLQDDYGYSDYLDSLENSLEMSDELIYQSTEMHPDMIHPDTYASPPSAEHAAAREPLSLRKIIDKQMDSDEEEEIRLLLATSLHGASDGDEDGDCDDTDADAEAGRLLLSPGVGLDESVDEAAVLRMQRAIDAALAGTYEAAEPHNSTKFVALAEFNASSMSVQSPAGQPDAHFTSAGPADGYYSDMDSCSDNDLEEESQAAACPGAESGIAVPRRSPATFVSHDGSSSAWSTRESGTTRQEGRRPSLSIARKVVEAEYSDMSSNGSADDGDGEYLNDYVVELNTPQLRSLELQPLARRVEEALVGGRNQDYLGLAYMYKLQRPYSDHSLHPLCVLCHHLPSEHVFFPCEHRCVCQPCLKKEKFCEEGSPILDGYFMCPLCAGSIKRILPHEGGAEVVKYWAWVEEISPALPPGFLRAFGHSAKVLKNVYVGRDDQEASAVDSVCKSS